MNGGAVEVDLTALQAYMHRLAVGLERGANTVEQRQATTTANAIRAGVPVRTGRLASTVRAVADRGGWAVTYGSGLRYAAPMEKRSHAVARGVSGAQASFVSDCRTLAAREAGKA